MIRKYSQNRPWGDDKINKNERIIEENQYYLPQPNPKALKTPQKQAEQEEQKDKYTLKLSRKRSQNASGRINSITLFKTQLLGDSKDLLTSTSKHNNARLKVQQRKIRSTSHSQAITLGSRSALKLQLGTKKDFPLRKVTLKQQSPSMKPSKTEQKDSHYHSYYNNTLKPQQTKTSRTQKKVQAISELSGDLNLVYGRCMKVIEDYRQQLQQIKRQNTSLKQENKRLKLQHIHSRLD